MRECGAQVNFAEFARLITAENVLNMKKTLSALGEDQVGPPTLCRVRVGVRLTLRFRFRFTDQVGPTTRASTGMRADVCVGTRVCCSTQF